MAPTSLPLSTPPIARVISPFLPSTLSESECFALIGKHATHTLRPHGWDLPGPKLKLILACLVEIGLDCAIVGQYDVVGETQWGNVLSQGRRFAIRFPSDQVFDARGLRGWDAIWESHRAEMTRSGDPINIQRMPAFELVRFRQELNGVSAQTLNALAPGVVANIQQELMQSSVRVTSLNPSRSIQRL
jgi:hypothetical protein